MKLGQITGAYSRKGCKGEKLKEIKMEKSGENRGPLMQLPVDHLNNDGKYYCDICDHQTSSKVNLAIHNSSVNEGVKFSRGQCKKQLTSQSNLVKHKRAVHEGVIYPCRQCNYQTSTKRHLDEHQRAVHEGLKYSCVQCRK